MSNRIHAAACAALLSCVFAGGASAHVVLDTREAPAGSYYKGLFRISHGCGPSPTVGVSVRIPQSILSARPQPKAGWTITIRKEALPAPVNGPHGKAITEVVAEVTWRGGPLPTNYFDEFALQMKLPDQAEGGVLYFPVIQECADGRREWIDVPAPGKSPRDYKSPAPSLRLTPKA
jgi:uncharacterized protein YcnI